METISTDTSKPATFAKAFAYAVQLDIEHTNLRDLSLRVTAALRTTKTIKKTLAHKEQDDLAVIENNLKIVPIMLTRHEQITVRTLEEAMQLFVSVEREKRFEAVHHQFDDIYIADVVFCITSNLLFIDTHIEHTSEQVRAAYRQIIDSFLAAPEV
jgi:hypothetical protein